METFHSYYPLVLSHLKEEIKVLEIYQDKLVLEDNKLILIASNKIEQEKLNIIMI